MWIPFQTTAPVPSDLEAVTDISEAEVDPRALGVDPRALDRVWQGFRDWYRSGIHPAIQVCVRRNGEILLNRSLGYAAGNGPDEPADAEKVLCTTETPFNTFSASKAVTAMVIHLLDQQRVLHLDDHVCDYIPDFACHNKEWITIRHLLTHRAGIPNLPPEAMCFEQLEDQEGIVRIMCDTETIAHPGRQVMYHALTGGFVLGEVVRRATGKSIGQVLREQIATPLRMRWFGYGVPRAVVDQVAVNSFTGLPAVFPISLFLKRALGVDFGAAVAMSNDPRFLLSEIPSGNLVATAEELSRFYQLLLNGGTFDGVEIFEPRTVRRATAEQSYFELDTSLGLPFRYSMGFMLGAKWISPYGPDTFSAYGHLGFTNVSSWADPDRQIAAAIMTNGKPLIYPALYHAWEILRQLGNACTREGARLLPVRMPFPVHPSSATKLSGLQSVKASGAKGSARTRRVAAVRRQPT